MIKIATATRFELFDNRKTNYTPEQVKCLLGCTEVFNSYLYDTSTEQPCCDIRDDGVTLNNDQYTYFGYGWNAGELPRVMHSSEMFTVDNYLSCIWAIHNGVKQSLNNNQAGIGGRRGRTAFGFRTDGTYVRVTTSDSNNPMTLTEVRDKLFDLGCVNAIILDGGGSSQVDTDGTKEDVHSSRIVSGFVCVWLDKTDKTVPNVNDNAQKEDVKMKVCLDAGHGGNETSNGSPDGAYKEHEFTLDLAQRIKSMLERCGVSVTMTRTANTTVSLSQRVTIANNAKVDLFVSIHSNAVNGGWNDTAKGLSVWTYAEGGNRDKAAKLLLTEMKQAGVETFGAELYHSKFTVLANTNMPAYLVEYAFHTCHGDVALLKNSAHRDKLAEATAKAICAYGGVAWVSAPETAQKATYKVQVDLVDETNAERLVTELAAKGYKPYITTEVKK